MNLFKMSSLLLTASNPLRTPSTAALNCSSEIFRQNPLGKRFMGSTLRWNLPQAFAQEWIMQKSQ